LIAFKLAMEDEDYLFIKDASDVRGLRRIRNKELNALIRSMLKSMSRVSPARECGWLRPPPVQQCEEALRDLERSRRNMGVYQRFVILEGQEAPYVLETAIDQYRRWIGQGLIRGNEDTNFQDANNTLDDDPADEEGAAGGAVGGE
jgi:hypothetical protein